MGIISWFGNSWVSQTAGKIMGVVFWCFLSPQFNNPAGCSPSRFHLPFQRLGLSENDPNLCYCNREHDWINHFFLGSLFSIRHYGHVAADNATILQARDPSTTAIFGGYCWQTFLMDTLYSHSWTTHTDNSFSQTLSVNTRFEDSFVRDNAKTETVLDMGWATPYYYSIFGNQHPAKPAKI